MPAASGTGTILGKSPEVLNVPSLRQFDLVVFDWDGTVVDSIKAIADSIRLAAEDLGFSLKDPEIAKHVIGLGLQDALSIVVPGLPKSKYSLLADRYRYHFLLKDPNIGPFPGIESVLRGLRCRGHDLGIATGKSHAGLTRSLATIGFHQYFRATRTADKATPKPSPDMIFQLTEEIGVATDRTLMIGDTTHDLKMAGNAGVKCVAVSYGAHPAAELERMNPLACVDSVEDLEKWLISNA